MQIQSLQGKRWFIWALVIIVVAGVLLVTYIMTSGEDNGYATTVKHQVKDAATKK